MVAPQLKRKKCLLRGDLLIVFSRDLRCPDLFGAFFSTRWCSVDVSGLESLHHDYIDFLVSREYEHASGNYLSSCFVIVLRDSQAFSAHCILDGAGNSFHNLKQVTYFVARNLKNVDVMLLGNHNRMSNILWAMA
jgi:hypothetical protein